MSAPHGIAPNAAALATTSPPVYPPGPPSITANPGTIVAGGFVLLIGINFTPGETITITITLLPQAAGLHQARIAPVAYTVPQLQPGVTTVTANVNGAFSTNIDFTEAGVHLITATGSLSRSPATAVETVVVTQSPPPTATPTPTATATVSPTATSTTTAPGLPVTGPSTNYVHVALIGSAIAATGVVLVVLARSRRRRRSDI